MLYLNELKRGKQKVCEDSNGIEKEREREREREERERKKLRERN